MNVLRRVPAGATDEAPNGDQDHGRDDDPIIQIVDIIVALLCERAGRLHAVLTCTDLLAMAAERSHVPAIILAPRGRHLADLRARPGHG